MYNGFLSSSFQATTQNIAEGIKVVLTTQQESEAALLLLAIYISESSKKQFLIRHGPPSLSKLLSREDLAHKCKAIVMNALGLPDFLAQSRRVRQGGPARRATYFRERSGSSTSSDSDAGDSDDEQQPYARRNPATFALPQWLHCS